MVVVVVVVAVVVLWLRGREGLLIDESSRAALDLHTLSSWFAIIDVHDRQTWFLLLLLLEEGEASR